MTDGLTITTAPALAPIFRTLTGLPAHERAVGAGRLYKELRGAAAACTEVRSDAIKELRSLGLSQSDIGELIGVSQQAVSGFIQAGAAAGDPPSI